MKKRRLWLYLGGGLCLVIAIICIVLAAGGIFSPSTESFAPARVATADQTQPPTVANTTAPYTSPVDFDALQKINPDIYAWIDIPGTKITYPVVQSKEDDAYYLDHNSDMEYDIDGAIFSEHKYNKTDFSDYVTVLYGHNMMSGAMFGTLQELYSDPEFLKNNNEIIIYLPDKELHFNIFAATQYNKMHLLHYYPFEKSYVYEQFFDELYLSRYMGANFVNKDHPHYGDKVVVLSTCVDAGDGNRYLVMGVCKQENGIK